MSTLIHVVSNASFLDTDNEQKTHRSLPKLLRVTRLASTPSSIAAPHGTAFNKLAAETGHCHDTLFSALRKMEAICGPERESFDAEISHNHVAGLPGCEILPRARLNSIRDELMARVYRASSLSSDDPSRHWCCVSGEHHNHPQLAAKRISVQDVLLAASEQQGVPFRYLQGSGKLTPGSAIEKLSVLERKLLAAGLQSQLDVFTTRMLSAESRLLETAELAPERIQPLLDQLENVVKAEYAEALLVVERDRPPYGNRLLADLYGRLRVVAEHRSSMIDGEPYETLAGVAAMLTAECLLWWGPRFEIGGNP